MSFGPIMRFTVGELTIDLAPLSREAMGEFINPKHGGGMQRHTVTRYLGRRRAPTLEDEQAWYDDVREASDRIIWGIWVVDGEERTLIGSSGLDGMDKGNVDFIRGATSGSMIFRPEYWGKGIASAAHKARTWYAFTQIGLHRITSAVVQTNGASSKALSRSGYTFTHTVRNEVFVDGQLQHENYYECLNPLDLLWQQWWHGDPPPAAAVRARKLTEAALKWAGKNVELQ